jgi:hypothetical protein
MGRGATFAFLVLVLIPNAFSIYEESVYSDAVEDGDTVKIGGKDFMFKIDPIANKTYVEIDVSGTIINGDECKIKDGFDVCISNIEFSYRNYEDYYDIYKAKVDVYKVKSKLEITSSLAKEKILIDEEVAAEMLIENNADVAAENVVAISRLPSNVLVTEVEGCSQNLNQVIFQGTVSPRQIRKCTYTLKGISAGDFDINSSLDYFDGTDNVAATDSLTGEVRNYSLKLMFLNNRSKFKVGEKFDLGLDAFNTNADNDLTVTVFSIKIPEKISIVKRPSDTTGHDKLIAWTGTLSANENKTFQMTLQGLTTGEYEITADSSYRVDKFLRKASGGFKLSVECDCPYITHDFSQIIVVPGQRAVLTAGLINPGADDFRNVKLGYVTDVPGINDFSAAYNAISSGQTIKLFDSSIVAPNLGQIYYVNITVVYESFGDEVFRLKENIPIKVFQSDEAVIENVIHVNDSSEQRESFEEEITQDRQAIEDLEEDLDESLEDDVGSRKFEVNFVKFSPFNKFMLIIYVLAIVILGLVVMHLRRKRGAKRLNAVDTGHANGEVK